MLHFALLLYLLSFTTGIVAITALGSAYHKTKAKISRLVMLTDVFFALVLLFDSISYYMWLSRAIYPVWLFVLLVVGQYSAILWKTYYCILTVSHLIGKEYSKPVQLMGIGICYIILFLIYIGYQSQMIHPVAALKAGYSISNVIAVSGSFYCIILGVVYFQRICADLRRVVKACLIILAVFEPFSITQNILRNFYAFDIPGISMSATLFFLLNGVGLVYMSQPVKNTILSGDEKLLESDPQIIYEQTMQGFNEITPRELEIMKLISKGYSNREIGAELFISANTVKNHIYNIYKKTGVKNRIELMNHLK